MFVVYEKESTLYLGHYSKGARGKSYESEAAAKAALTRASKGDVTLIKDNFAVAEYSVFCKTIEKTVTKRNCVSGQEFTQPANTAYPDPSHEGYHQM